MRYLRNNAILSMVGLFCIGVLSCNKEIPCNEASATLNFIAFPDSETDTIIVKSYTKATNLTQLVDSFFIDKANSSYLLLTDTLQIGNTFGGDNGLKSTYDYEIFLPQTNRVFTITAITEVQKSTKGGGLFSMDSRGCSNPITSYKLNGQLFSGEYNYFRFYLRR